MTAEIENTVAQLVQLCRDLQALATDAEPYLAQSQAKIAVSKLRDGWAQAAEALEKVAANDDSTYDLPSERSWSNALSALFMKLQALIENDEQQQAIDSLQQASTAALQTFEQSMMTQLPPRAFGIFSIHLNNLEALTDNLDDLDSS